MTKSQESGENYITEEAKKEAKRSGEAPCEILARWLEEAKATGNMQRVRDILRAQKYLGCRNKRRRS